MHLESQMDSGPFSVLEIWCSVSSGFTTGATFCWSYFSVKVTRERSSQLPLRITENAQNHWGRAIPSSDLNCSEGSWNKQGSLNGPCSPSHWDSSPQGWNPLDWAKPDVLSQCHCCQWRETGRCGYGFSSQFGWCTWSFSSASCGKDKIMSFMWLQFVGCAAVLGKLFLNLTPILVTNGVISSINFYF